MPLRDRNAPHISHGSVATYLRCGGIIDNEYFKVTAKTGGKNVEDQSAFGKVTGTHV